MNQEEAQRIKQEKRKETYEIREFEPGVKDSFMLMIPAPYVDRELKREYAHKYGPTIDDVFLDYGELYIRLSRTIRQFICEGNYDQVEVRYGDDDSYIGILDIIENVLECQFHIVKHDSISLLHFFTIEMQN